MGEPFGFKFKGREKPFYKFSNKAVGGEWKGKAIGKRELAWRLGWWTKGMMEKGSKIAEEAVTGLPSQ